MSLQYELKFWNELYLTWEERATYIQKSPIVQHKIVLYVYTFYYKNYENEKGTHENIFKTNRECWKSSAFTIHDNASVFVLYAKHVLTH